MVDLKCYDQAYRFLLLDYYFGKPFFFQRRERFVESNILDYLFLSEKLFAISADDSISLVTTIQVS